MANLTAGIEAKEDSGGEADAKAGEEIAELGVGDTNAEKVAVEVCVDWGKGPKEDAEARDVGDEAELDLKASCVWGRGAEANENVGAGDDAARGEDEEENEDGI